MSDVLVSWGGAPRDLPLDPLAPLYLPNVCLWSESKKIEYVCPGDGYAFFLTKEGKVITFGNNEHGQLGHQLSGKKPQLLAVLESYRITVITCGIYHSHAVNEWGQIFSWGGGERGQLGLGSLITSQPSPKIIRDLAVMQVLQVACGYYHSIVLMNNGELYSWGCNNHGQLGLGTNIQQSNPTLIKSLSGVPFSYIACGGYHTFAITKSGALYAWGKNSNGQLGLNDTNDKYFPTLLKNFRSIHICQVSCGENFSLFLSQDGGVFACGANNYGQLGHGDVKDEWLPKKIVELMGTQIVQIACGRSHFLVVSASRKMQACGLASNGQLGTPPSTNVNFVNIPKPIYFPWEQSQCNESPIDGNFKLIRVFSGADVCYATISEGDVGLYDGRVPHPGSQIPTISSNWLKGCAQLKDGDQVDQDVLCYLETVFKSLSCFNASFLTSSHHYCGIKNSGVDIYEAESAFKIICDMENATVKEVIKQCISENLMKSLNPNPPDTEALRYFLSLPMYHEMLNSRHWEHLQVPLAKALAMLKDAPLKILTAWYHTTSRSYFERVINVFKSVITYYFDDAYRTRKNLVNLPMILPVFDALERLNVMNEANAYHSRVSPESFYISDLGDYVDVKQDYINWLSSDSNGFYFCNYPFLFDALCKTSILELDQSIQMHAAMNQAATVALHTMLQGGQPPSQFLNLKVSRDNIVEDTLRELTNHDPAELKKPLKVKFHNEEAEDGGGVRKEFFLLLLREILDPKYGMFKYYPESRCVWFAENSFEDEIMFQLIGLICGLAIYNFTIINVSFPLALYKKLLKAPLTLEDLEELDPTLTQSLQSILDYEGNDVEEVFGLNFEISTEVYGVMKVYPLKENGGSIAVTRENKSQFVELYVDFIFNKSIIKQFEAFYNGFNKVCGGRVFQLFQPHELMTLVVGNEEYNWVELESGATYRGGYNSSDPAIVAFWEVFYELTEENKKKFLHFLTGCDRVPIQGMKAIKITIQPTSDDKFLPVAHTCFNLLDLPRYSTREKLRYKLLQAIEQKEGFSLV